MVMLQIAGNKILSYSLGFHFHTSILSNFMLIDFDLIIYERNTECGLMFLVVFHLMNVVNSCLQVKRETNVRNDQRERNLPIEISWLTEFHGYFQQFRFVSVTCRPNLVTYFEVSSIFSLLVIMLLFRLSVRK